MFNWEICFYKRFSCFYVFFGGFSSSNDVYFVLNTAVIYTGLFSLELETRKQLLNVDFDLYNGSIEL